MKLELAPVVNLLHRAQHNTLATQSQKMPGYPYATVVPCIVDEHHRPILLISALAEHTKNLLADPRVSISATEPGTANVQDGQRLTLVGDAEPFVASPELQARYLRYLPAAEQYLMLDFMFVRINPKRVRYIGGVGKMGWVECNAFASVAFLPLAEEATLLQAAQSVAPKKITLLGIDSFGIDYLAAGLRNRASLEGVDGLEQEILKIVPTLAWPAR